MIYEFRNVNTGEIVEVAMPMKEAVPIGDTIVREGETLVRVPSSSQELMPDYWKPYTSVTLPRWCKGAKMYDRKGRPRFRTKTEERDFIKVQGDHNHVYERD